MCFSKLRGSKLPSLLYCAQPAGAVIQRCVFVHPLVCSSKPGSAVLSNPLFSPVFAPFNKPERVLNLPPACSQQLALQKKLWCCRILVGRSAALPLRGPRRAGGSPKSRRLLGDRWWLKENLDVVGYHDSEVAQLVVFYGNITHSHTL